MVQLDTAAVIAEKLVAWYRTHKRDLPWRGASPYAIWVSEIMLQQTQVVTVIPYFLRFMERFPTVEALAEAPLEDVLQRWAGLGYYARARNLHRAAIRIVSDFGGRLPNNLEEIQSLPGIGRYTAGAILSIAYDIPTPLVDANVIRVLSRLCELRGDPKAAGNRQRLWETAERLVPAIHPGDFNQALMELGALICRSDEPLCEQCPLLPHCFAGNSSDPTQLPEIPAGRAAVAVTHVSVLVGYPSMSSTTESERDEYLVIQRPPHGLWGGLWEFPRVVLLAGETPEAAAERAAQEILGLKVVPDERLPVIKHAVTHHRITLYGVLARAVGQVTSSRGTPAVGERRLPLGAMSALPFAAPQTLLLQHLRDRAARNDRKRSQTALEL